MITIFLKPLKIKVISFIINSIILFSSTVLVYVLFTFSFKDVDLQLISFPDAEDGGNYFNSDEIKMGQFFNYMTIKELFF